MMRSSFLQSPQVLVVEASAGSGKTFSLAKRYVQLSLYLAATNAVPIQSILAITFTNKATWAMKSRILDFLKRIALKQLKSFETDEILRPLGIDESQASLLAFGLMKDVIRQYHYFQVQTIDSFVNVLLSGCSFKIGLSARFKIQRNSRDYLLLSLDELLDQANDEDNTYKIFSDFVQQYLFLENRSGWFPKDDLLKVMVELFRQYNTFQKPLLTHFLNEDVYQHKRKIYTKIQELKDQCPPKTKKNFLDHLDELLVNDRGVFDIDELKSYWSKEEFPLNKGGEISPELEKRWQQLRQAIHDLCLLEAQSMFNPYVVLFEKVLAYFGRLSRRDDVLFLEELNRKAALLFENELVTVEELYFRLAARFNHYLMDEFQDTSLAQWRNLTLMVEEALSHGGSLFYVGDKKQAIYAFRGGESLLFDALQRQLVDFNVEMIKLDRNFRSCPEIINFNNRIFSIDNLHGFLDRRLEDAQENKRDDIHFSEADFKQFVNTFGSAEQRPGKDLKGGVVRVTYLEGRVKQERALEVRQRLIPMIEDLRGRFALKDMAILTRGNREVEEITQWLLQEGIYASSDRSSDIKNNPLIVELMHLLAFLYAPINNHAFTQFCLGDLVPQATGIEIKVLQGFLFDCARRSKQVKDLYFYKEFRNTFPQVWEDFFEDFFRQVGVYPLYELTAGIIKRFECEKNFPQYQGFLMHLLELVKQQEKMSCDLSSFLDYFENFEGEDRFVPMGEVDAVKVLTVHKAKGLEFPVVIVPFLEMDIKAGSGGRDGSQAYILDIQEEGMSLIRNKEKYREFCPELQTRYEQEYKKSFLIELNNIYVAMTRAIEELYIFVPGKVGNTVNPAKFLIPEDCLAQGTPALHPKSHQTDLPHQKIKPFVSDTWVGLKEEFLDQPKTSAKQVLKGEFYHAMLMHITSISEKNLETVLNQAWDKASQIYSPEGTREEIIKDLHNFINRDDVRPFFYLPADAKVYCEKEFVNKYGDTKRIDRMIVSTKEVQIIDFKLSPIAEGEHQKQIEGYIELIRQFYPKHKVLGHVLYLV